MTLGDWEDMTSSWSSSHSYFLEIIILARQISALWILPTAFYRAFLLPIDALITGDGSFEMSPTDKIACIRGGRILETKELSELLEFLYAPRQIAGCQSPEDCDDYRTSTRFLAEDWRRYDPRHGPMLLRIWDDDDWIRLQECCPVCLASMRTAHRLTKDAVWDRLLAIFDLPKWSELEQMKGEAFQ
jgi:hypothetical protein